VKPATKDDVFDLLSLYATSAALGAAMESGLFWQLEKKPMDAAGVAKALGIPVRRCQYWLQLLGSIGLVERVSEGYVPSSAARTAILDAYGQESWALLAQEARERFPAVQNLALHIHEHGSAWAAQGLTPPHYFAQIVESPERARRFTRMLYEFHQSLADELANLLDMTGVHRLMDLGGGSGVVSLALLREHPQLTSVVVDTENVCVAGREIAAEHPAGDRISYHAADFLNQELPGQFDMVLQCDTGIYREALFRKLGACLNPGGRLVIVDQFAPAEGVAPASRLHWAFLISLEDPNSSFPTADGIQTQLTQAGFRLVSEGSLSGGWVVIEASR
jgi:predicted O-methyltransferase YrrM